MWSTMKDIQTRRFLVGKHKKASSGCRWTTRAKGGWVKIEGKNLVSVFIYKFWAYTWTGGHVRSTSRNLGHSYRRKVIARCKKHSRVRASTKRVFCAEYRAFHSRPQNRLSSKCQWCEKQPKGFSHPSSPLFYRLECDMRWKCVSFWCDECW